MAQAVKRRMLVMENGSVHEGTGFGSMNDAVCELVFNTSMVGYQEIVTDPSYTAQTVVMTYPLIGNDGTAEKGEQPLHNRLIDEFSSHYIRRHLKTKSYYSTQKRK